jgi:leucyl aminopeptidase (aminopeptidase T)
MQWMSSARVAVEFSMRVQPGEKVLIVTDPTTRDYPSARDLADAIYVAARYLEADVSLIEFPARTVPNEELPEVVASAMLAADVIFLAPTMAAFHTQATRKALAKGARVLGIFGGDSAANTIGKGRGLDLTPRSAQELEEIGKLTTKLASLLRKGGTLRATTRKGTDVTCEIGELEVLTMDALYQGPGGMSHFVPGIAGGGPNFGSARGTLVVDASITPVRRPPDRRGAGGPAYRKGLRRQSRGRPGGDGVEADGGRAQGSGRVRDRGIRLWVPPAGADAGWVADRG